MKASIIVLSVLAITQAQFVVDTVSRKPWTGPIANHQLGVHPDDTPEVAAAKAQHLTAFQHALAVLPELPPEERYIKHGLPLPAVRALQLQAEQQLKQVQIVQPTIIPPSRSLKPVVPVAQPVQRVIASNPPVFTVFAEEIPRSSIGEVPEVHAARVAHLKAVQEAKAGLPLLTV